MQILISVYDLKHQKVAHPMFDRSNMAMQRLINLFLFTKNTFTTIITTRLPAHPPQESSTGDHTHARAH